MRKIQSLILSLVLFFTVGCASLTVSNISNVAPLIKGSAAIATSQALSSEKSLTKRKADADMVYSLAVGARTITGTVPTAEQVRETLKKFGAEASPELADLAVSLSAIYSDYYNQYATGENVKAAALILEKIAQGAEQAALAYR